ncbi:MAG: ribbon-helix-helix protein, CopG family [Nitrososphaerota archaeon]|nr:ribbon-helix-helix protein, CopG family [Nitrososphaerota archaeon]MDG6953318.1 ribbon-helix-helix protein, CopG family [Nitrososphaerota archaeon]MDG6956731.1 ribbon-helix-helix protein, CopG family [Nitrososphaerota archaeon]MDG6959038.1 ribbon-helix-helix protein, CopG family [Nitrososphaerota archaeon]MDG6959458.1 ribbon-helix-helix protein, CopG family [Nitrososphaerota archaeon]
MKRSEYTNVKIRRDLAGKLDEVVRKLGYSSRDEVAEDAIRRFVDALAA